MIMGLNRRSGAIACFITLCALTVSAEDPPLGHALYSSAGLENKGRYGWAVDGGYDVNGDGQLDAIVGEPELDYLPKTQIGRAALIFGPLDSQSPATQSITLSAALAHGFMFVGRSVSFSEKFNDDSTPQEPLLNYSDIILGAPGYDLGFLSQNYNDAGAALVVFGGVAVSSTEDVILHASAPMPNEKIGHSVANVGYANGDEFTDILIGSDASAVHSLPGRALLYFGSTSSLPSRAEDVEFKGESSGDKFGYWVDGGANFGTDSFDDLLIGAPKRASATGTAYLIQGRASFNPSYTMPAVGSSITEFIGEQAGDNFGHRVSGVGDVDGDGIDDLAITAPYHTATIDNLSRQGAVYIFFGRSAWLDTYYASGADIIIYNDLPAGIFGESISAVGDLNNDEYDDFAVGDVGRGRELVQTGGGEGAIHVIFGGPRLKRLAAEGTLLLDEVVGASYTGNDGEDRLGRSVALMGDIDDDLIADFVVGASGYGPGSQSSGDDDFGAVFIYSASTLLQDVSVNTDMSFDSSQESAYAAVALNYDSQHDQTDSGMDLLVTVDGEDARLYQRLGTGTEGSPSFLNVASSADVFSINDRPGPGHRGIGVADFDNDGTVDMFVAHATMPRLYRGYDNAGTAAFEDVAESHGLRDSLQPNGPHPADESWAGVWGDYNRDGYVDLYVCRAAGSPEPSLIVAREDRLFRSDILWGDGLIDVLPGGSTGIDASARSSITASWTDQNDDGWLDLAVGQLAANGGSELGSSVYENDKDGTFTQKLPMWPSVTGQDQVSSIAWADVDRDGNIDMILGRMEPPSANKNVTLWRSLSGTFDGPIFVGQDGPDVRISGLTAGDLNADGLGDLVGLSPDDGAEARVLMGYTAIFPGFGYRFWSVHDRTEHTAMEPGKGGALTLADFDADGDDDAFLGRTHASGPNNETDFYYKSMRGAPKLNQATGDWLRVILQAPGGGNNSSGFGCRIRVTVHQAAGDIEYEKVVGSNVGRGSQGAEDVLVGLGQVEDNAGDDVTLDVIWPDGYVQTVELDASEINQTLTIVDDHTPGIDDNSISVVASPRPGSWLDWYFSWDTSWSTDAKLDYVEFREIQGPRVPVQCQIGTLTFGNLSEYLPKADGTFEREIKKPNWPCYPCTYEYRVVSLVNGNTEYGDWDTVTIPGCLP